MKRIKVSFECPVCKTIRVVLKRENRIFKAGHKKTMFCYRRNAEMVFIQVDEGHDCSHFVDYCGEENGE